MDLVCGAVRVRVDDSICAMAAERVHCAAFAARDESLPLALTVKRVAAVEGGTKIDAPLGVCTFRRDGDVVEVALEDGMWRGELVLRLAWYLAGTGQGAVLIHANALSNGSYAFVAAGKSGDGKSTLARLSVAAELTLLTDEVVMLFPDGRVSGTPFRSDVERPGTPGLVPAKYFFALEKAQSELLKPLSALQATQLAMAQCFDVAEVALPRAEVRQRLLMFLSKVEPATFAFRKEPAAGELARALLSDDDDVIEREYANAQTQAARGGVAGLPSPAREVFTVTCLRNEVENGGFGQYFINETAAWVELTIASLLAIGAPKTAAMLQRASEARTSLERLAALDEEFYASPERLTPLLARFCRLRR